VEVGLLVAIVITEPGVLLLAYQILLLLIELGIDITLLGTEWCPFFLLWADGLSGGAAQPEAQIFIQKFLIGHVVGTITGEGEADHAVEDVDGGRAQVDDVVSKA